MAIHASCCSGYLTGSCTPSSGCLSMQPTMIWVCNLHPTSVFVLSLFSDCISFSEVFNDWWVTVFESLCPMDCCWFLHVNLNKFVWQSLFQFWRPTKFDIILGIADESLRPHPAKAQMNHKDINFYITSEFNR